MKRGAFIVLEGVDRTGKTTQAKKLVESLNAKQIKAEYTNFPARDTEIGKVINSYLALKNDLHDKAIHLLFSANRWERAKSIKQKIDAGITLVVDRYCFSGVAFSAAKGLDLDWCKSADVGLPKPDKVFFLTMEFDAIKNRDGFGEERYEVLEFQKKVLETYSKLEDKSWEKLNANRSMEELQTILLEKSLNIINDCVDMPLDTIWEDI